MMDSSSPRVRVAILGANKRVYSMYAPILNALPAVELVGVWSRSEDSAKKLGESLGLPWYTDIGKLVSDQAPQIGVVCVSYGANGQVGLAAVEAGLNVLLETPIAHKLSEADAIIRAAQERHLKIEIGEQFHRRPLEQIKLTLIASGLLGKVYSSFSDFAGHGYHGISVMRSYLGFDAKPVRVVGSVHEYPLAAYYSRLASNADPRNETQEHGLIEFEGSQLGVFHWTSVGYDSPLRWWRSSRFLAERGMGITVGVGLDVDERISILSADGEMPQFITIERRTERTDGGALHSMIAHCEDANLPRVVWDNPFRGILNGLTPQWHDDEIGMAGCIMSLVNAVQNNTEPTYGPYQGRLDQELITAIRQSAAAGSIPVSIPLDPAQQTH